MGDGSIGRAIVRVMWYCRCKKNIYGTANVRHSGVGEGEIGSAVDVRSKMYRC